MADLEDGDQRFGSRQVGLSPSCDGTSSVLIDAIRRRFFLEAIMKKLVFGQTIFSPEDLKENYQHLLDEHGSKFLDENMPLDQWLALSARECSVRRYRIYVKNMEWFEELSRLLLGVAWCIVINHKVIQYGTEFMSRPSSIDIMEIAKQYNLEPIYICPIDHMPIEE